MQVSTYIYKGSKWHNMFLNSRTIGNLKDVFSQLFTKRQILDSSKQEEFADDNFKSDENGRKFSKHLEKTI